jgi:hypothetical protein
MRHALVDYYWMQHAVVDYYWMCIYSSMRTHAVVDYIYAVILAPSASVLVLLYQ